MLNLLSKYKAYLYIAAFAAGFGIGYYVGKGIQKGYSADAVLDISKELNSCKNTVIEMSVQSTNAIVSQQLKINEVAKNADEQIKSLETNIDSAVSIADRLRNELKKAERNSRTCESTPKPSAGSEETQYLFTDMYTGLVKVSRDIAIYADKETIAHHACLDSNKK